MLGPLPWVSANVTSTSTYHCFYVVSANVNTMKKANDILVSYKNSFDRLDFLGFVKHTLRIAGRDGHSLFWIAVTALVALEKKEKRKI